MCLSEIHLSRFIIISCFVIQNLRHELFQLGPLGCHQTRLKRIIAASCKLTYLWCTLEVFVTQWCSVDLSNDRLFKLYISYICSRSLMHALVSRHIMAYMVVSGSNVCPTVAYFSGRRINVQLGVQILDSLL